MPSPVKFSIAVLLLNVLCHEVLYGYVLNTDPQYQRWPNGKVPFWVNPGDYSQQELSIIGQAMSQMNQNTGGCVQFIQLTQLPAANTMNHVVISKSGGPGVPSPTCFSYPGNLVAQNGVGQDMSIQGGQSGCLSDARHVMRLLASLLGLRSEHNKPNRDSYITVSQQNVDPRVQPYVPLNIYDSSKVNSNPNDFDFNSITLIDPVAFSGNGGPVIQSRGPQLYNTGTLSMKDCQALTFYYQCQSTCQDPYGAGGLTNTGNNNFPPNNNIIPNNGFNNVPNNGFNNIPNNGFNNQIPNNGFNNIPNNGFNNNVPNNGFNNQIPNNGFNNQIPNNGFNNQIPNNGFNNQIPNNGFNNVPNNGFNNIPNNGFNNVPNNGFNNVPNNGFNNAIPNNGFNNAIPNNGFNNGAIPNTGFNNGAIPNNGFNNNGFPNNNNAFPNNNNAFPNTGGTAPIGDFR